MEQFGALIFSACLVCAGLAIAAAIFRDSHPALSEMLRKTYWTFFTPTVGAAVLFGALIIFGF